MNWAGLKPTGTGTGPVPVGKKNLASNSVRSDQALPACSLLWLAGAAVVHRRASARAEGKEYGREKNPKSCDVLARTNKRHTRKGEEFCLAGISKHLRYKETEESNLIHGYNIRYRYYGYAVCTFCHRCVVMNSSYMNTKTPNI